MASSFVASLRKLAEDAAEAKRMGLQKAKLAEKAARAEALRIRRQEEALAREEARLALLQTAKEKRKHAAEAERQRRQADAIKRAEQMRIDAEIRKAEMEERKKREDEKRARLRELRRVQLCSDIYSTLAVAAWDGVQEVEVDDDASDFKTDLHALGVSVNRRNKLARLATNALTELRMAADQLAVAAGRAGEGEVAHKLRSLTDRIQKSGQPKLASQISKFSGQVAQQAEIGCDRAQKAHQKLLSDVGSQERAIDARELAIDELKADIGKRKAELADVVANAERRQAQLRDVASRIQADIDNIGSSYQAQLPAGLEPRSYETKAAALRVAYGRFIHGVDFEKVSVLEIINLMRLANGRQPMESFYPVSDGNRSYRGLTGASDESTAALEARLSRMSSELSSSKARLASNRAKASYSSSDVRLANDVRAKAQSFHCRCIQFERSLGRSLEGVDCGQLRFAGGQYIGPTTACLDLETPAAGSPIANAYAELRWLSIEDGRDFAGYMDIVLSELAKEGARSVDVSFVEGESESRVVVGNVSLVCKISAPLMERLFSKRGIAVDQKQGVEVRETLLQLSW